MKHFRLVGGTALSLLLGHRMSVDLDLFTDQKYGTFDYKGFEEALSQTFPFCRKLSTGIFGMGGTYYVGETQAESIKLDVFYTEPFVTEGILISKDTLPIASLEDIIPMKLEAIVNRGSKKDFWDIHEILEHYTLPQLINLYEKKYPYTTFENIEEKLLHFDKADNDFDPICLKGKYWDIIKWDIESIVNHYQLNKI